MQPLTMKQWAINCLAIYGAYRLITDYAKEHYGVEVVVRRKDKEVITPEVVPAKEHKKWAFTISR